MPDMRGISDPERPMCQGTKKNGERCKATECSDGYCSIHHPDRTRYKRNGLPKTVDMGLTPPRNIEEIKDFLARSMVEAANRQRFRDLGELARVLKQFYKMESTVSGDDIDSMSLDDISKELGSLVGK